jgi:hypothetical protein
MYITLLTLLVIIETFIISSLVIFFLIRKNSRLNKAIADLLKKASESLFSKLVNEEIEKTKEYIKDETSTEEDNLDLSATDDKEPDPEAAKLQRLLTYRSAYLHAELNAYELSDNDQDMYWHYLAQNLENLLPKHNKDEPDTNEFLNEIMQELQLKLDKSLDSNRQMQNLIAKTLLADENTPQDQKDLINRAEASYHDLVQHLSDLENKIENSLNLDIETGSKTKEKNLSTKQGDNIFYIEKKTHVVNTEVNKLKDVIYEQGNKINALLKGLKKDSGGKLSEEIEKHIHELELAQQESSMCMEILEMENNRLIEEIAKLDTGGISADTRELTLKILDLEQSLDEKDKAYAQLDKEYNSVQKEFMALYHKQSE